MALVDTLSFILRHPLNRGRAPAALFDFAKWQIRSRMVAGPKLHRWFGGASLLVHSGETGLTGNLYAGLHEFEDMAFVLHLLRPGDTFFDIGANSGAYTVLAAKICGARVEAFEPLPDAFRRLSANIRLNGLEGEVRAHNIGLGRETGSLGFTRSLDTSSHVVSQSDSEEDVIVVAVERLDSVAETLTPIAMKIDVEGFELPVLEGASRSLSHPALLAVLLELNGSGSRYGFKDEAVADRLFAEGFRSCRYEPFSRSLVETGNTFNREGNTLFARDLAEVRRRVADAPFRSILGNKL